MQPVSLSEELKQFADDLLKLYTPVECEIILKIAEYKERLGSHSEKYIMNKIHQQFNIDDINSVFLKLQVNKIAEDNTLIS